MTIQEQLLNSPSLASKLRCYKCARLIGDHEYDVTVDGLAFHVECPARHTYLVAVYLEDRAYGGPEEGGWWYDCGELVRIIKSFASHQRALAYRNRLNDRLRSRAFGPNVGRRDINSVLSEGQYYAYIERDTARPSFPERRPHYE